MTATNSHDNQRYSSVAILLHWLVALLLAIQLSLGAAMPKDESAFALYQLHKSVGIAILALTLLRLGWRLRHGMPPPLQGGIGALAARAVHAGFYLLLVLIPLTGWALVSTAEIRVPTILFGVVTLPHLPLPSRAFAYAEQSHAWLSWIAILLILLHVAGALRHQLILRDRLFQRMAPRHSATAVWFLGVLVLCGGVGLPIAASLMQGGKEEQDAWGPETFGNVLAEPGIAVGETDSGMMKAESDADLTATAEVQEDDQPAEQAASPKAADAGQSPPRWNIQPGGRLAFSVRNGTESVGGSFVNWSGTILFDPDRPETADLRIEVNLSSASVGDATMDEMLRGAEFFAVEAFPTAHWQSRAVTRIGTGRYRAEGRLSLKGVSRSQPLVFALSGNRQRQSVTGSATIDRSAFGIGTGSSANNLSNSVTLEFSFVATGGKP